MIGVVIVVALALVALAWVAVPLRNGRRNDSSPALAVVEARARRRAALSALVDIEEDLEIGKLSPADYEALRTEYEREALRALEDLDALGHGDSLEAEIAAMRRQMTCPSCGALRNPGEACDKCDAPA